MIYETPEVKVMMVKSAVAASQMETTEEEEDLMIYPCL